MIELPAKFKKALGNGVRTSLYPIVRIYKDIQIDDEIPEEASINLSIKETSIKNLGDTYEGYKPLLLSSPSIKSSADIINNKYTISSVSLSISNAPYKGKIFSDDIQSYLNAVVQVYYAANGLNELEDCLLVYTGTIRRFSQSAETIKLELEDVTEEKLKTKIPSTIIPDTPTYKKADVGKPFPMIYGFVDKTPLITLSQLDLITGASLDYLQSLAVDKPSANIKGKWNTPLSVLYNNPFLVSGHPLIADNLLNDSNYLFIYDDGYAPIMRVMPKDWSTWVEGDDGPEVYVSTTFEGKALYTSSYFHDNCIQITDHGNEIFTTLNEEGGSIPTRVYRPIVDTFFYGKHRIEENNGYDYGTFRSYNKMFGFSYLDKTKWDPRNEFLNSPSIGEWNQHGGDAEIKYEESLTDPTVDNWWAPTEVNDNTNHEANWSFLDTQQQGAFDEEGLRFNSNWIQNNDMNYGIHLNTKNLGRNGISSTAAGAFVKMQFNPIANAECVTNLHYKVMSYCPRSMGSYFDNYFDNYGNFVQFTVEKHIYPSRFWLEPYLYANGTTGHDIDGDSEKFDLPALLIEDFTAPYVPSSADELILTDPATSADGIDEGLSGSASAIVQGMITSELFKNTNQHSSVSWGAENHYGKADSSAYLSLKSCINNLHEFYILQDLKIDDAYTQDFYASMEGRTNSNDDVITSPSEIIENILKEELLIENTDIENIFEDWQFSFTITEQKEAKVVFQDLFKSSIIIPFYDAQGTIKCIPLHQNLDGVTVTNIDSSKALKYSFSLTKLDDIKTSVNVKYNKNYASGEFDKQTGYSLQDNPDDNNLFENYEEITKSIYPDDINKQYSIDYYGLNHEDTKLEIETEYIRDDLTARKLQNRLVSWHANQHLIVKIDLPVSYINLEVGDYIKFNELIGGMLAFGYDYTKEGLKNGQFSYKAFFITKISKSLGKISIEAVQVHRGEYGEPDGWVDPDSVIGESDNDIVVDGGGNNGQGNFEQGDPNDDPNYNLPPQYEDEEEEVLDDYISLAWENSPNLDSTPTAIIDTNIEGEFTCEVYISNNDELYVWGDTNVMGPIFDFNPQLAGDYINTTINYNVVNGVTLGGSVQISSPYLLPLDYVGTLTGFVKITNGGIEQTIDFFQNIQYDIGDVNEDAVINVQDIVILVQSILVGTEDELPENADVNDDGVINVLDVVTLINLILGGTTSEIAGCTNPTATNYNPDATYDDGSCYITDDDDDTETDIIGGG